MSPAARASGAGFATEHALFHAYRKAGDGIETRACVCGGRVHADPDAPGKGVAQHNHTGRHKAWRLGREG